MKTAGFRDSPNRRNHHCSKAIILTPNIRHARYSQDPSHAGHQRHFLGQKELELGIRVLIRSGDGCMHIMHVITIPTVLFAGGQTGIIACTRHRRFQEAAFAR